MKKLTCFSLLFFSILGFSQTVPIITEFRLKFANEKIDFRYRPIFYFQNNTNMRRELFLGYTFNKNTKLFSYTRYNDYQKKLYTGLRFDHKIVLNKLSLNNQFRYLNNLQDPSNDVFIYIPDLLYTFHKGIKAGLRGFVEFSSTFAKVDKGRVRRGFSKAGCWNFSHTHSEIVGNVALLSSLFFVEIYISQ